ncbi:MAG TPA: tRNA (adenosine(37)-N6)-dimethylallyltransferase MiaA [Aeromicrobium sp.]|nr:tRNA (adenosine(37)-N6)-dimethylallyltransferase MiaA [Aeromicrobium sp.]
MSVSVVVGPTASGKSALAVALCRRLAELGHPAEVINADSMQLYRGMDVGTAKITPAEQRNVPHHLLDVLDVTAPATVAEFQEWSRAAIAGCRERGVVPVVVGGSSLYIRAVIDRLEFPGTDADVRARWDAELDARGPEALHAVLAERDAEAAAQILPSNGRRIVRALEVIELTGEPFAATLPPYESIYDDVTLIGLDVPRDVLDERIADRVVQMWADGLVDEVRALVPLGLADGPTASRALGYRQVLRFIAGEVTEEEARAATIAATRAFARRQDRLFRKDPRIHWLAHDSPTLVEDALALVHQGVTGRHLD